MHGKVVIITGAASGIGAATATLLAKEGARLVLADIDVKKLNEQVDALRTIHDNIITASLDVRKKSSWESVLNTAIDTFRMVDVVVHCAGVDHPAPFENISEAFVRQQIDVNLTGAITGTQVMLRYFLRKRKGHIIHIASLAGLTPLPNEAVYSATKFGLRGFCLALDLELRKTTVHVSVVSPDSVDTPMLVHEALNNGSSLSFSGAILSPQKVAEAIAKVIRKPKREVFVPAHRGWLAKLANIAPGLLVLLFPFIDMIGKRNQKKYVRRFDENTVHIENMKGYVK
jgi:2-dehydro-3-deoxy-L-rhamnonate dehydrogenase (NAD+)